jgi:hypothetical protein
VISTPPKPAAAIVSSSRVRFSLSTPLPSHHHLVQGLHSREIYGQEVSVGLVSSASARPAEKRSTRRLAIGYEQGFTTDSLPLPAADLAVCSGDMPVRKPFRSTILSVD